jgi:hypothetical protein
MRTRDNTAFYNMKDRQQVKETIGNWHEISTVTALSFSHRGANTNTTCRNIFRQEEEAAQGSSARPEAA